MAALLFWGAEGGVEAVHGSGDPQAASGPGATEGGCGDGECPAGRGGLVGIESADGGGQVVDVVVELGDQPVFEHCEGVDGVVEGVG